ncbi:MAG: DEAD/DEAH box helicase [Candidatus Saccharimonadales bacterium]
MPFHTNTRSRSPSFNSGGTRRRSSSFGGGGGGNRRSGSSRGNRRNNQYIDPARFIKAAKPVTDEVYVSQNRFVDFEVHDKIKQNLGDKGFIDPTPIQDQSIPAILNGSDLIGIANTGTGKTAAFAIPLIHKLMQDPAGRALIVAPTRELAQQIEQECQAIGKGSGIFGALLIGGTSMGNQLRDLRHNPNIVIGTPGRIMDHMKRGTLNLQNFNYAVLDEVDRMLDMGFVDDVRTILDSLAEDRQSLFFSATLDNRVRGLIETFSKDPVMVSVKTSVASENVHQDVIRYSHGYDKLDKLHDLLTREDVLKVILFDETQRSVEKLSDELIDRGFKADAIHGGKSQGQRERALRRFKKSEVDILVATDVAARGIDVADISHVINYTQPQSYEDYIHRVGRAGRAGKIGYALTFVNN